VEAAELRRVVDVVARLNKDGQACPLQAGDLEGRYKGNPTLVGVRDVEIEKAY